MLKLFKIKELLSIDTHTKAVAIIYLIVLIGIVLYFSKNFKKIDMQLKAILVFLFFCFLIYYGIEESKKVISLRNNFSLTSGNIEEYVIPKLTGRGAHKKTKYIYEVNGEFVVNQYQENYYVAIPEDKQDFNILYLVIYDRTNPKNSFMLLNYPIKNPNDLEKYRELFAEKIPDEAIKSE